MAAMVDRAVRCDDSGLSIAANVIGILTFVLGAALTYFTYFVLTVNALEDIQTIDTDIRNWRTELQLVITHCEEEYARDNFIFRIYRDRLQTALERFNEASQTVSEKLDKLPKFNTGSRIPHALQIRRRMIWVLQQQKIIGSMDQLRRIKADVYSIFICYLIQYVIETHLFLTSVKSV